MRISVDPSLYKEFPGFSEVIIVAKGINNNISQSRDIVRAIEEQTKKIVEESKGEDIINLKEFSYWREVYSKMESKNAIASHEALVRRILKGGEVPNINPLVNYYNLFSIQNFIPSGAEDLSNIYGDVVLERLRNEMPFLEINSSEIEMIPANEICWHDKHSVTCKNWGWRQSERTKITKDTKDCYLCLDIYDNNVLSNLEQSIRNFAISGQSLFGGQWNVYIVNESNPSIDIDYESKDISVDDALKDVEILKNKNVKGTKGLTKRKAESLGLVNDSSYVMVLNRIIVDALKNDYPSVEGSMILDFCSNKKFGDFSSNVAFRIAPILKKSPYDTGLVIANLLQGDERVKKYFSKVDVARNGFINFFIRDDAIIQALNDSLSDFVSFTNFKLVGDKSILIESPSANPNKPLHVGHLLNVFLGKSLMQIFERVGFTVYNDNIMNDRGMPICKAIWALKKYGMDSSPEKENVKPDHFVGKYYVIGSNAFKESKEVEAEVRDILKKWESGDEEIVSIWKKIIGWVLDGQSMTMKRIGEEMGHMWFESQIYEKGKEIILERIDGEKIVKNDDGAIIGKIEQEYGVPDVVLIKSDGTALYHTQDLYLTLLKIEKFNPWKAIWIVGNEQITHFQRLFSLIDSIQLMPIDNLYHLAYGFVFDKDGKKMSSRTGDALSADELIDIVKEKVMMIMKDRQMISDLSAVSESVAIGALKYAFLSSDPFKDMRFDIESSTSFNGKSGPYIMYSFARARNILKKIGGVSDIVVDEYGLTELGKELSMKCLEYPDIIVDAANNYSPSLVAEYLFELAKLFNQYYEVENVLSSSGMDLKFKQMLLTLVSDILKDGLSLLKIPVVDSM